MVRVCRFRPPRRCCSGPGRPEADAQWLRLFKFVQDGGAAAPVKKVLLSSTIKHGLRQVCSPFFAGTLSMRRLLFSVAVLAAVLLSPLAFESADAYTLSGKVVHVADGDTLTLLSGRDRVRVRLASIDAPEIGHGRAQPGQPYGKAARQALADLVAGKNVRLHCYEQDQYGREICDVPLDDGRLASQALVASGMVWANQQGRGKYMRDASLPDLQRRAKQQHLGLWRDAKPVPPWEWRYKCWKALETGDRAPIC